MVGTGVQQDAEKNQVFKMSSYMTSDDRKQFLHEVREFSQALSESLDLLVDSSELVELRQGQTLLRASTLETHAFVVIDGALRLLAEEPFKKELFSVGRAEAGQLVGVVGLLRQSACEGAIARRPTKLIGLPLELLSELIVNDKGLKKG